MKLIVGLGNPGEKYQKVRHNLGFMLMDKLAESVKGKGESWKFEKNFNVQILNFTLNASPFTLVKPHTFMNNSGIAVRHLADYYKIAPEDIIVIHDDLDLHLGRIKVRLGGSGAGHHGIESVIKSLGTDQFIRVRLGIGNDKSHPSEDFVLEQFQSNEKPEVKHMLKNGLKALEILLEKGLETAQNQFN